MKKLHLFKLLFAAMFVMAATAFTACSDDDNESTGGAVTLDVTPATLAFDETGGAKTFAITTNGTWKITGVEGATWLAVTPALSGSGNQTITVTVGKSSDIHNVSLKVTAYTQIFGIDKEIDSKTVAITQTPGGIAPSGEVIYGNNFDKAKAEKGDKGWPFLDQTEVWQNATGTGNSTVTYAYTNMSVRTSGKLSGGYEGASGVNKIFFGKAPASFEIKDITLPANATKFALTVGVARSPNVNGTYDNIFKPENFKMELGNGTGWANVTYTKTAGDDTKDPFWVYLTANFTLSAPMSKVTVKFTATESSCYSIDDVKLTEGVGGQTITFGDAPKPGEATAITIAELNAMCVTAGATKAMVDAAADRFFEAVVVTDVAGGNVNANNLQVMTQGATTANNGITLYGSGKYTDPRDPEFAFAAGDKVKITLKMGQAQVTDYQGLHEVTGAKGVEWVLIEKIGTATLSPVVISADKLAEFQGMRVSVQNATSPATAAVWCTPTAFGIHNFTVGGATMVAFAQAAMPSLADLSFTASATGTISGYASVNNSIAQICPQSAADVAPFMGAASNDPAIVSVTPAKLSFAAAGESKTAEIVVRNATGLKFKAIAEAPFTASITGQTVTVVAPANTTAAAISKTLTIQLLNADQSVADTQTVALTQAAAGSGAANYESMAAFLIEKYDEANACASLKKEDGTNSTANGAVATGIKLGTSKKAGVFTSPALGVTGSKTLSFFGVAWKGKKATLYVRVNGGGTVSGGSVALAANDGATGNPPFTMTVSDSDQYSLNLQDLTAASTITVSTSADFTAATDEATGRAVLFGIEVK
ncbi:MAG: hypothetical protein RR971_01290 [Alistipes sp.]